MQITVLGKDFNVTESITEKNNRFSLTQVTKDAICGKIHSAQMSVWNTSVKEFQDKVNPDYEQVITLQKRRGVSHYILWDVEQISAIVEHLLKNGIQFNCKK